MTAPHAPPACIALAGPTASGKSAASLAIAARWPVEIISVDSALVYRGMDIGTAKPPVGERERFGYGGVDLVDPDWGLLATGLIAGTVAFLIAGRGERRRKEGT